jgi:Fanconi anemia group M protein
VETQKILKSNKKLVILCDYRESEVNKYLKMFEDVVVNESALEVGDFICSQTVAIERKTHEDFINSIIDGRIFEQAKHLKENFERPILFIEGYSTIKISENALKAAIASLLIDFGLSIINTRNPQDTAKTIYWIAKKEQEEKKKEVSFKLGRKPKEIRALQEEIVASLPGVGKVLSKRLLEHFKTLKNIFNASEEELKKVKGISESTAKKIRKILTLEYYIDR